MLRELKLDACEEGFIDSYKYVETLFCSYFSMILPSVNQAFSVLDKR